MNLANQLKVILKKLKVTNVELAEKMDQSPQNFGKKLRNGTLNFDEFTKALDILGVQLEYSFKFPGTETIGLAKENEIQKELIEILEAQVEYEKKKNAFIEQRTKAIRANMNVIMTSTDVATLNINDVSQVENCIKIARNSARQIDIVLNAFEDNPSKILENPIYMRREFENSKLMGKRILLVEDDDALRGITRDLLESMGMFVDEARDGFMAVTKVKSYRPTYFDAVLIETELPVMSGFEAATEIRKLPGVENMPIIALAQSGKVGDREAAKAAKMNDYIVKPLEAYRVADALELCLR